MALLPVYLLRTLKCTSLPRDAFCEVSFVSFVPLCAVHEVFQDEYIETPSVPRISWHLCEFVGGRSVPSSLAVF